MADTDQGDKPDLDDGVDVRIERIRDRARPSRRWTRRLGLALSVAGYLVLCRHLYFVLTGDVFSRWNVLEFRFSLAQALSWPVPAVDFPWQVVLIGLGFAVVLWAPMYLARCTNNGVALLVGAAGCAVCPARLMIVPILVGLLLQMGMAARGYKGDRLHMVGILPGVATLLTLGWVSRQVRLGGLTQAQQTLVYLAPGLIALAVGELLTLVRHTYQRNRAHPTPPAFVILIVTAVHICLFQAAVGMEFMRYSTARVGEVSLGLGPPPRPLSTQYRFAWEDAPVSAAPWPDVIDGRDEDGPPVTQRQHKAIELIEAFRQSGDSGAPMKLRRFARDYPDSPYAPIALVEAAQLSRRSPNPALLRGIGLVYLTAETAAARQSDAEGRELLRKVRDEYTASGASYLAEAILIEDDLRQAAGDDEATLSAFRDRIRGQLRKARSYLRDDYTPRIRRDLGYMASRLLGEPNYQTRLSEQSVDLARRILLELDFMLGVLDHPPGALKAFLAVDRPLESHREQLLALKARYGQTTDGQEPEYAIYYEIELALQAHPDPAKVRAEVIDMVSGLHAVLAAREPEKPTALTDDGKLAGDVRRLLDAWPEGLAEDLLRLARSDGRIVRQDGKAAVVELGHPRQPVTETALERLAWYRLAVTRLERLQKFIDVDVDRLVNRYTAEFLAMLKPVEHLKAIPDKRAQRLSYYIQPEPLRDYGPDKQPVPLETLLAGEDPFAPLLRRPNRLWQFYLESTLAEEMVRQADWVGRFRQVVVKLYVLQLFKGRAALHLGDTCVELYRITGKADHARAARQFFDIHERLNPNSRHQYRIRQLLNGLPEAPPHTNRPPGEGPA